MQSTTGIEWSALAIQAIAAVAAAVAAVFAWVTARQVKLQHNLDRWLREGEQLNRIHSLVTELVETAHDDPARAFSTQLNLRAELSAVTVSLPWCRDLVDGKLGDLEVGPRRSAFDRVASSALAEVEKAQRAAMEKMSKPKGK